MIDLASTSKDGFAAGGTEEPSPRAEQAEKRLRNALRELKTRSEDIAEDVRAVAVPARVIGVGLLAGLGALLVVVAVRAATRRRPPRRRTIASRVGRSIAAELATRAALGAAGVIGAHLASEVLLPAMTRRLAADAATKKRRTSKPPTADGD